MTFGERLRNLRETAGLTQKELADRAGLVQGAVGHWETGLRSPSWGSFRALCLALNVSCEVFADCDPPPADKEGAKDKTKPKRPRGRPRKSS